MIPERRSGEGKGGGRTIQKYQVIYADPPWDYQQCRLSGSAKKHYPTMRIEELCLLATKGHPKRQSAGIHQLVISPVERHSKKPDEVREKIVALMGDVPRIELFARQQTPGWDVWGNEVENSTTLLKEG